ncbi:MAG: uridine kinase [Clostridia bacterium]|nr:uridine kinase [Clostridia bacterium]
MSCSFVIGICGGTGSGKTTLAKRLSDHFQNGAAIISMDNYYRNYPELTLAQRSLINYDHPDSIESELLIKQIEELRCGNGIDCPLYDFSKHLRKSETLAVKSERIIIIEGILLFAIPELLKKIDYRIFVDADPDIRIIRRILRDVEERGRSLQSVTKQYIETVKPMHDLYVEPYKNKADFIFNSCSADDYFNELIANISQKMK